MPFAPSTLFLIMIECNQHKSKVYSLRWLRENKNEQNLAIFIFFYDEIGRRTSTTATAHLQ